ncbi:MAG: Fic family protein [Desulfovibrionaceae bacterium]
MKFEEFKPGRLAQRYQYKSFTPTQVNHEWTWESPAINTLLEQAVRALAELDAFSLIVPDIDLFIYMHVLKEANNSSRIEGTQTDLGEDLLDKELVAPEKRDDWQEVQNYVQAMHEAIEGLKTLPLSSRLLRKTHETLLSGVRGEHRTPGEYRRSQNWIGGASLKDAVFIPPTHEEVPELMADLERFWHNENIQVPDLIRAAISHYQFETIHPFLDGNGRIGRLLITLYLIDKGLLVKPSLYLSDYLGRHKGEYYDALTTARTGDLSHWVSFLLLAVRETGRKGKETFGKILALRKDVEARVQTLGKRAHNGVKLLSVLYKRPLLTANQVAQALKVSVPTANSLVADFQELGILTETTGNRRYREYAFGAYYKLFLS